MFFCFFHMLTSRRARQSLNSEHQHVQLFTWTYEIVTIRRATKPFMITIFHGFFSKQRYQDAEMVSHTVGLHGAICDPGRIGSIVSFTLRFVRLLGSCNDTLCSLHFPLRLDLSLEFCDCFLPGPRGGDLLQKTKRI